ncbi:hypothetical protein P378_03790 [Desulforamulus profundi]|uniref:RND transporter n=1 Tax=Desulforamulus profundi TaxID=1383067 RepID=A0A2C6MIP5_9FIRM|nr:efflux RND transporter periplasmic adaptor subunit [Desulforamulus profundi]PHJ39346.1 hypothetical protein P378_03790 [Desulforamulus profundi]
MQWSDKLSGFKSKKALAIGTVLICLGLAGSFFLWQRSMQKVTAEEIKEVTVQRGDLKIDMEADVKAEQTSVVLNFPMEGIIKEIPVAVGSKIKAGDVIARLDPEKYELELQSARANYEAAQAKLAKAREDYQDKLVAAKEKLDNARLVYEPMSQIPDAFSKQELSLKKTAADSAAESYELAKEATSSIKMEEANVAQALVALKKAEKNLADTVLRSPVDGTVLYLGSKVGEHYTTGGDNGDKKFAVVAEDNAVYVNAKVLELDIGQVSPGQVVEVKFEALRDELFPGKVTGIIPLPQTDSSGVVSYEVDVQLDRPEPRIKNGMTGTASFILVQKKDVLMIPNAAVRRVDGAQVVEKLNEQGQYVTQRVKTGFTDGTNVEVISGLKQGDKVIIRTKKANQGEKA